MLRDSVRGDLVVSVSVGVFTAAVFSAWTGLGRLLLGSEHLARYGTGWLELSAAYFGGALAGGILVGLLFPLRRHLLGIVLLGFAGAFPFYLSVGFAVRPEGSWNVTLVLLIALVSLVTGSLVAAGLVRTRRKT